MTKKKPAQTFLTPSNQKPLGKVLNSESPFFEIVQIFFNNFPATLGFIVLCLIALAACIGPALHGGDPFEMVWAPFTSPGMDGFLLGTDQLGRDMLLSLMQGARATLAIAVVAAIMSVFIGVCVGAFSGFYRGWVEECLMRLTELFQVLPPLLFSMVIVALFGASLTTITMAIGVVSWTAVARITRGEFLRIRELDYVMAARSCGASHLSLIFKVILPNALPPIIVQATLMVGSAILFEAMLAFLGLSDPNTVSWGQIIGAHRSSILTESFTVTIPSLAIFVTVLSISLVGDGLNDALNPKLRQR